MASRSSELKNEVIALKRKRIVDAARRLFYEKGYERTTLDDIAERLQVTKPFIYSYYKNKNELLHEIAQQCISQCLQAQSRILNSKLSIREKLSRIVEEVTQVIIENQANTIIYLREEMNLDWRVAQKIREQRNDFDHKNMKLLRDGARSGSFKLVDERVTARCIGGMLVWCALWYRDLGVLSPAAIAQLMAETVMRMVGAAQIQQNRKARHNSNSTRRPQELNNGMQNSAHPRRRA
ncbi:MAG TPA: TetR/AcrR family transcriptional regulator [Candidatus Angelobacter sp.]|nr:TetR/AcrR family transcriptional regulator [Candidatus Angelobacter sp.]